MTISPWQIDHHLADDLAAALGWSADDGAARLAERIPSKVLCGSTAKLAAVAADEVPPGADPDALARQILTNLARGTSPAWSCWVVATVMAALLDDAGYPSPQVAAVRRVDPAAPTVDFHSTVVVVDGGPTWLCDPYFGLAVPLPTGPIDGGEPTESDDELRWARATVEPGDRWLLEFQIKRWESPLAYRVFAPSLDRLDVHSLCAISVSHSGVPARPYARLHPGERVVVDAHQDESGANVVTRWPPVSRETCVTWDDAVDAFAALTGVRVT